MSSVSQLTSDMPDLLLRFRQRVAEDLALLATLHDYEPDTALVKALTKLDFPYCLTLLSTDGPGVEAQTLMRATLVDIGALLKTENNILDELAADYASIYLNHSISASPLESVWLDEDSLMCQTSMFQVRNWYESYELGIPDWRIRPDDHLVYQLQFMAALLNLDDTMQTLEKLATFMDEHLLRWLGNFSERVMVRCETSYFANNAVITATYSEKLRDLLADILNQPRPSRDEIDARMQPKPAAKEVAVSFMPGMGPAV